MKGLCCSGLEGASRRYIPMIPESDQPDAEIEFHTEQRVWLLRAHWGEFALKIAYRPCCGSELAKLNP